MKGKLRLEIDGKTKGYNNGNKGYDGNTRGYNGNKGYNGKDYTRIGHEASFPNDAAGSS